MNEKIFEGLSWKPRDPQVLELIKKSSPSPEKDELILLNHANLRPDKSKSEHREALGWSINKFNSIFKKLEAQLLTRGVRVFTGGRGGVVQLIELTQKGLERINKKSSKTGRGGAAHFFYIKRVEKVFKDMQYVTKREAMLTPPAVFVDLRAWKGEEEVAIEVELNSSERAIERIIKLVEANIVNYLFLFSDKPEIIKKTNKQIDKILPKIRKTSLTIMTVQDFFKERRIQNEVKECR